MHGDSPDRLYYGTDTRALPAAARAARWRRCAPRRLRDVVCEDVRHTKPRVGRIGIQLLGLAGIAGLVLCWLNVPDRSVWLYRGGFIVVAACAGGAAALVRGCAPRAARQGAVFKPLRYIGAISYGLYLYHWPLFQLITHKRTGLTGAALLAARFGVTFAVAVISYHLLEQPIRRGALSRARLAPLDAEGRRGGVHAGDQHAARHRARLRVDGDDPCDRDPAGEGRGDPTGGPHSQAPPPKPPELNAAAKAVLNRPIRVLSRVIRWLPPSPSGSV